MLGLCVRDMGHGIWTWDMGWSMVFGVGGYLCGGTGRRAILSLDLFV